MMTDISALAKPGPMRASKGRKIDMVPYYAALSLEVAAW